MKKPNRSHKNKRSSAKRSGRVRNTAASGRRPVAAPRVSADNKTAQPNRGGILGTLFHCVLIVHNLLRTFAGKIMNKVADKLGFRLPKTATPSFYDLRVTPDLNAATFSGDEKVTLEILKPVRELVLNAAELNISQAVLSNDAGDNFTGTVEHDEKAERATIRFDRQIEPGHYELSLKFTGILNDKLKGFYLSKYQNDKGGEERIATTKFEPCDARRAFPCWDEPAYKARFKISLVIDKDLNAISNARLIKTSDLGNGKKLLEFAPSIVMSTYLVAYVIGKLEASQPIMANGKQIRVWSVPGKAHLSGFALDVAKFALEYFAKYFEEDYPGDKLDLVAIPDFASGAMENFACITFRETALLLDPKTASHAELERVAEVVCHEIAHMWFGDLVTMGWWNGLWLNEAFATFMATKAVDAFRQSWKFWDSFNIQRAAAMRVDGLKETRAIEMAVGHPEEARQMFDVLTYEKGCSILRMLELYLGQEQFRRGIVNYIAKHKYANTETPDLWSGIAAVVGKLPGGATINEVMDGWVFQPGYPVISVAEAAQPGHVTFRQRIFRYAGGELPDTTWFVPIHVRATTSGGQTVEKVFLLSKPEDTFLVDEGLTSLVVNAGGHGFYRVQYSAALRDKLMQNLGSLTPAERFNFINDLWASVQAGQTTVKDYLYVVHVLTSQFGETDVNVFSIIIGSLNTLRLLVPVGDADTDRGMLGLALEVLTPALNKLSWSPRSGETPQDAQLRGSIFATLGAFGDPAVISQAQTLFAQWKSDKTSVDTNLIGAVVNTLARNGDAARYSEYLDFKGKAATPQEENRFLMALAQFRQPELIARTLDMCVDGTMRSQDAMLVLPAVLQNPYAGEQAWQFVKTNWEKMEGMYPMQAMGRIASGITALISPALEADVRKFFSAHYVKGGEKSVKQYMEQLSISVQLQQRQQSEVVGLLATYKNGVEK